MLAIQARPAAAQPTSPDVRKAADAYKRATFVLNLNPVAWEQVRADTAVLSERLRSSDPKGAEALSLSIDHLIAATTRPKLLPRDSDLPPDPEEAEEHEPLPGVEAARQAFEYLTRAVGSIILRDIDELARNRTSALLERARADYAAFGETVQIVDSAASARLTEHFEDLGRILAKPTTETDGPAVSDRIHTNCEAIRKFILDDYGPSFSAPADRPLAPWPVSSPTFNRDIVLPVRLPPGSQIAKPLPRPRQILNSVQRGAKERDTPLISLGAAAFNNPFVLGEPARSLGISCNTCHNKSGINPSFFIPGLSRRPGSVDVTNSFFAPHANNAVFDPLDIPDLRGIRFTQPYGRNGRTASLRDFSRNVIVNEFNGDEPDPILLDAIVAYMNEFDFLSNPALNANGSLNGRASPEARRGEALFAKPFPQFGNLSCASCHIPSANFVDHLRHDIGTVRGFGESSRDRAMDTPTLLGTVFTAPYFHDGSQPTLRDVVEWFNKTYKLNLTAAELGDLTAYVSTVGNGVHAMEPGTSFVAEDMEDQESFLSAFDFLAAKSRWSVAAGLFRGISLETRHQADLLGNRSLEGEVKNLAQIMTDAAKDADSANYQMARTKVAEWRRLYKKLKYEVN